MPEPKAQLIDPQGPIDVPGMQVTGVTTATGGFVGNVQGTATGLASTTTNLSVGIVTATKFQGNTTGNVSGLADDTNINVGIITSTSFTGDLVGNAAGLSTTTANINAGIMSATSFSGNFTGVASGITGTPNIVVGIMTGTLNGDGSSLTGIAATNWITNNVTANSSTTTVNLSLGNVVKFAQNVDTTVSFANTGTSNIVTFIRGKSESFTSGAVTFDGDGDYLSLAASSDLNLDGDFTIEAWVKVGVDGWGGVRQTFLANNITWTTNHAAISLMNSANSDEENCITLWSNTSKIASSSPVTVKPSDGWTHIAITRSSNSIRIFKNGVQAGDTVSSSTEFKFGTGETWIGQTNVGGSNEQLNGKISNLRIVKGTAVYTGNFTLSFAALTNVTNTKLLCCQDTSSTTVGSVKPGTITANGDPTAGSENIFIAGERTLTWPSAIKWDGGTAPTLDQKNLTGNDVNVITLLTRDEGVTWYGWENVSDSTTTYTMWGTGSNEMGVLGQNSPTNSHKSSPVQIPGSWTNMTNGKGQTTDAAGETLIATKSGGTLWSWGYNAMGQLGLNNTTQYSSPVQIPGSWGAPKSMHSGNHSVVLKSDGTLWSWGNNDSGQLGQNDRTQRSSPVQVPGTSWSKLGASMYSTWAIKTDNTLWAWGNGGQLGTNSNTNYSSPVQIDGTWLDIGSGYGGVAGVKLNGTLWTWGTDYQGLMGHNNRTPYSSPKQVGSDTNWKQVTISETIFSAVKTNGELWVCGYGGMGLLGQNNTTNRSSPIQIPGTTWKSVANNTYQQIATKTDGTLWVWGYNSYGGLGQNNTTQYSSPIQIPGGTNASIIDTGQYWTSWLIEE